MKEVMTVYPKLSAEWEIPQHSAWLFFISDLPLWLL
jgi:hypothetical protein